MEVYLVDGVEVLRMRSFQVRGDREFTVGTHRVTVRIDSWPSWQIILRPWEWIAQAYVDGELAVDDITPELRAQVKSVMQSRYTILAVVLMTVLGILAVALVVILIEFMLSRW
jgi:hypothetical protein